MVQAAVDVGLLRLDPDAVRQLLYRSSELHLALEQRIEQDRAFKFPRTLPLSNRIERSEIR